MPSFILMNRGSSSIGSPKSVRNTCEGNGVENRSQKSISVSPSSWSMSSFTSAVVDSSSSRIRCGANSGSSSLRYFLWSGGSICSGISGRLLLRSAAAALDEKTSGWRSTCSTPSREATITPTPSSRKIGVLRLEHGVDRLRMPGHLRVHQLERGRPRSPRPDSVMSEVWTQCLVQSKLLASFIERTSA